MSKEQKKLIKKAYISHKQIFPCGIKKLFSQCFSKYKNKTVFWFNTLDGSTHVIK